MSTDDLQAAWGNELKRLREARSMSQNKLARLAELDTSHYRRIEAGDVNAGDGPRMRIAAVLGVAVEEIWRYPRAEVPS
jgi:transcriptional regulator with XRE-family HTH domain